MDCSRVKEYFDKRYPDRTRWYARFFRSCDGERAEILVNWLPALSGKSVCDVGCGDGVQMHRVLSSGNIPSCLTLQDLSGSAVARARETLSGFGCQLSGLVGDVFVDGLGGSHHVVVAIGMTDYYHDREAMIRVLLDGASELLIVDFPKKWHWRNIPRRIWLGLHGVKIYTTARSELDGLMRNYAYPFEIIESKHNWAVKITKNH